MWMLLKLRKLKVAFLYIFALSPLVGCGKQEQKVPDRYIDSELAAYMDEFVVDANDHGKNIDAAALSDLRVLKFVDDIDAERRKHGQTTGNEPLAGACTNIQVEDSINTGIVKLRKGASKWQEIWISSSMRGKSKAGQQDMVLRELVYHELGHCLLNLEHQPSSPHRIMSPSVSSNGRYLTGNWSQLVADLFN